MEWCDCYIVVLILALVGVIIYQMTEKFASGMRCGVDSSDDTDSYLKQMPFMDDIIYQNPPALNRRGYDILNSYNRMKVGPEINFHQKFNRSTMDQMGWRTWYLSNFC